MHALDLTSSFGIRLNRRGLGRCACVPARARAERERESKPMLEIVSIYWTNWMNVNVPDEKSH